MAKTKSILLDSVDPEVHKYLRYVATINGTSMKAEAAGALERGLRALAADPEFCAREQAHEDERAASRARFGFAVPEAPSAPNAVDFDALTGGPDA